MGGQRAAPAIRYGDFVREYNETAIVLSKFADHSGWPGCRVAGELPGQLPFA